MALLVPLAVFIFMPTSVLVVLGQEYLPQRVGMASGVTLGLAVSVGGMARRSWAAWAIGRDWQPSSCCSRGSLSLATARRLRLPPVGGTVELARREFARQRPLRQSDQT